MISRVIVSSLVSYLGQLVGEHPDNVDQEQQQDTEEQIPISSAHGHFVATDFVITASAFGSPSCRRGAKGP